MNLIPSQKLILQNLQKRPQTASQLQGPLQIGMVYIYRHMRALRAAGMIFISGWTRAQDKAQWSPVYSVGQGVEPQRPAALTDAERTRLWRKKNPHYLVRQLERQRERRKAAKARAPKKVSMAPRAKQEKPQHWRML